MNLQLTRLPDGREIHCVNPYEVDFSVHEIFNDDLGAHGIELPADGVFLDVGANIGLFSLHLLDLCPAARVFAYEPMPEAHGALARNLEGRAVALALGLGAAPGTASFSYFPGITALSSCHGAVSEEMARGLRRLLAAAPADQEVADILDRTGASARAGESEFIEQLFTSRQVEAPIDTLSNQIRTLSLSRIDLLKIDTEGAEKEVLAGLAEEDWPLVRQLVVEVHLGEAETDIMEQQLQARGYRTSRGRHPLANGGAAVFHIYARRAI